jgi:hypothetical protein
LPPAFIWRSVSFPVVARPFVGAILLFSLTGCGDLITFNENPQVAAVAPKTGFGEPDLVVKLKDSQVKESSGLAAGSNGKTYYTHNDSGDSARFFSFDLTGNVTGEYTVTNARNVDWEEMAAASMGGKPYLFLADIGDNGQRRESVQIYRVPEPKTPGGIKADRIFDFSYPDGPHNAEAILVDGKRQKFQIITKISSTPALVFEGTLARDGKQTLKKLGELEVGGFIKQSKLVTGSAVSPDRKFVAIRTYLAGYEFPYAGHEQDWFKQKPTDIPLAVEIQGEAITYARDGSSLLTSSEMAPCPIHRVSIKR